MNDRLQGLLPHPASVRPGPGTVALTAPPAVTAADHDAGLAQTLTRALAAVPWPAAPDTAAPPVNPGQRGGTGARRHRPGERVSEVAAHLDHLTAGGS